MLRTRLVTALAVLGFALSASEASAKCDPAAGWPSGKPCRDADQVGIRISGEDKSIQEAFDGGELGQGGGGGGAPTSARYLVSETHGTLSAEIAPTAPNQVPVSQSASPFVTWQQLTSAQLDANACSEAQLDAVDSPADREVVSYDAGTGRFAYVPRLSGVTASQGLATAGDAGAPTVGLVACAEGEVLKRSGSAYVCDSDGPFSGQENAILVVGDSWVFAAGYDEPWASFGAYRLLFGGFTSRLESVIGGRPSGALGASAAGAGSRVHAFAAHTTGSVFGAGAQFDLVKYLKDHREVRDVILLLGTNDYLVANCSHGDPVDPDEVADTTCTVPETIANLEYIFDQVIALGVRVHWQLPPAWLGLYQNANSPGAATYQDAIEDVYGALETYCTGKTCYPNPGFYDYWCNGVNAAPNRTGGDCLNLNFYDYGDGAGYVNKNNYAMLGFEDAIYNTRTGGSGFGVLRRHPSAWGYQKLLGVLVESMKLEDPTITQRHTGFAYDFTNTPAIPSITIGTVTSSSIQVTVKRGQYVNGSTSGLGSHECYLAACRYVCWATCQETGFDSDDPACYNGAETPVGRAPGAPSGAAHAAEGGSNIASPREYIELQDGETGTLNNLATGTDYAVTCVAVSPTNISHPAVRNQTTL
jgi:hypothetical protein